MTRHILNHQLLLLLLKKTNLESQIYHYLSPLCSHYHAGIKDPYLLWSLRHQLASIFLMAEALETLSYNVKLGILQTFSHTKVFNARFVNKVWCPTPTASLVALWLEMLKVVLFAGSTLNFIFSHCKKQNKNKQTESTFPIVTKAAFSLAPLIIRD